MPRFGVARSVADLCSLADRLTNIHHRAADRDHDVPRQPNLAVTKSRSKQLPTNLSNPISQKFLDKVDTLTLERSQRILDAKPRIPGLLWAGLLFGGVVLVTLGGFMRLGSIRGHLLLLGAVAVLLGLLLFVVYWLDHPFGNQLGVTSAPFEQALTVFDSIDSGT